MFNFFKKKIGWGAWREASGEDLKPLLDFIAPSEHAAVPFSSRLLNTDGNPDPSMLNRNPVVIEEHAGRITSAIMLSPDGIVCPVFGAECGIYDLYKVFESSTYFRKRYITLMGESETVKLLTTLFSGRNSTSLDYYQLTADSADVPGAVRKHLDIKGRLPELAIYRASADDIDLLMPLRKAYEIEEVVLNAANFNESACRRRFQRTIKDELVFYAESGGQPVGTCCINAHGVRWSQIGGVYTVPSFRSRGISAALMSSLAVEVSVEERNLTLFVKTGNEAALKLYDNCGFGKSGDYRITYLESR